MSNYFEREKEKARKRNAKRHYEKWRSINTLTAVKKRMRRKNA